MPIIQDCPWFVVPPTKEIPMCDLSDGGNAGLRHHSHAPHHLRLSKIPRGEAPSAARNATSEDPSWCCLQLLPLTMPERDLWDMRTTLQTLRVPWASRAQGNWVAILHFLRGRPGLCSSKVDYTYFSSCTAPSLADTLVNLHLGIRRGLTAGMYGGVCPDRAIPWGLLLA
ncbi:hypothetical protein NDU88_001367 [Pleurodeles waltl]|uniref:Uncharacterized protein n=1 Tax=Pleurodeles waltl TaxID=8319 RepID=A0AAV7KT96_PLEWA|nr:hypothetical protein NDU88_001367 [Pleurodeles waltl]